MDEIVFQREVLRRELIGAIEAFDEMDGESVSDDPLDEVMLILRMVTLNDAVQAYSMAVADHLRELGLVSGDSHTALGVA